MTTHTLYKYHCLLPDVGKKGSNKRKTLSGFFLAPNKRVVSSIAMKEFRRRSGIPGLSPMKLEVTEVK